MRATRPPTPRTARAPPPPPRAAASASASSPSPPPPGQQEFLASPPLPSVWPVPAYNRYRLPVNVTRSVAAAWELDTGAKGAVTDPVDAEAVARQLEAASAGKEATAKPPPPPPTVGELLAWLPQFIRFVLLPEQVRFAAVELARALAPLAAAVKRRWVLLAASIDKALGRATSRAPLAVALDRWHGRIGVRATLASWVRGRA